MRKQRLLVSMALLSALLFSGCATCPFSTCQPKEITVELPGLDARAKPLTLVEIPAGRFLMGSLRDERDRLGRESHRHRVTITEPFFIGRYEVTQAQWETVMGSNPCREAGVGPDHPVFMTTYDQTLAFIEKLNALEMGTFRMPTEAEWEYACRAGTTTRFFWGDDLGLGKIGEYAWTVENSGKEGAKEVGLKQPNPWGLYDICGNVFERCTDWLGEYPSGRVANPQGPPEGDRKVFRGGADRQGADLCRSASRNSDFLIGLHHDVGLRLVMEKP